MPRSGMLVHSTREDMSTATPWLSLRESCHSSNHIPWLSLRESCHGVSRD